MSFISFYKCPLFFLFGIPCPLCGMTRAFLHLFIGQISEAFYYHPLWPLALISLILIGLNQIKIIKLKSSTINYGAIILSILLIICYIYRHITKSPIVEININDGVIYKTLTSLFIKAM